MEREGKNCIKGQCGIYLTNFGQDGDQSGKDPRANARDTSNMGDRKQPYMQINKKNLVKKDCETSSGYSDGKSPNQTLQLQQQSPPNNNILQTMTTMLKVYKAILHTLQQQQKNILSPNYSSSFPSSCASPSSGPQAKPQIFPSLPVLTKNLSILHSLSLSITDQNYKKILVNRFITRLIQITILYRNRNRCRYGENQGNGMAGTEKGIGMGKGDVGVGGYLDIVVGVVKEYMGNGNGNGGNQGQEGKGIGIWVNGGQDGKDGEFGVLFEKICWIFRKCIKQLKQKAIKQYQQFCLQSSSAQSQQKKPLSICPTQIQPKPHPNITQPKSLALPSALSILPISSHPSSISSPPPSLILTLPPLPVPTSTTLQQKSKLTKQIQQNTLIYPLNFVNDIDLGYLKSLFLQVRNNGTLKDVIEDRMEANGEARRGRERYAKGHEEWRERVKKKEKKREKQREKRRETSERGRSYEGRAISIISEKNTSNLHNIIQKQKPKKIFNSTIHSSPSKLSSFPQKISMESSFQPPSISPHFLPSNSSEMSTSSHPLPQSQPKCQAQQKKRQQFKNMQALSFHRQFIHLSQIKNQKIARRPYAEVKQVLVAGDQINFYGEKGEKKEKERDKDHQQEKGEKNKDRQNGDKNQNMVQNCRNKIDLKYAGKQNMPSIFQNNFNSVSIGSNSNKPSFFLQRALKNDKMQIRKKSFLASSCASGRNMTQ